MVNRNVPIFRKEATTMALLLNRVNPEWRLDSLIHDMQFSKVTLICICMFPVFLCCFCPRCRLPVGLAPDLSRSPLQIARSVDGTTHCQNQWMIIGQVVGYTLPLAAIATFGMQCNLGRPRPSTLPAVHVPSPEIST
jgi:hypothetical protein